MFQVIKGHQYEEYRQASVDYKTVHSYLSSKQESATRAGK
jgi:hypothetical protein